MSVPLAAKQARRGRICNRDPACGSRPITPARDARQYGLHEAAALDQLGIGVDEFATLLVELLRHVVEVLGQAAQIAFPAADGQHDLEIARRHLLGRADETADRATKRRRTRAQPRSRPAPRHEIIVCMTACANFRPPRTSRNRSYSAHACSVRRRCVTTLDRRRARRTDSCRETGSARATAATRKVFTASAGARARLLRRAQDVLGRGDVRDALVFERRKLHHALAIDDVGDRKIAQRGWVKSSWRQFRSCRPRCALAASSRSFPKWTISVRKIWPCSPVGIGDVERI